MKPGKKGLKNANDSKISQSAVLAKKKLHSSAVDLTSVSGKQQASQNSHGIQTSVALKRDQEGINPIKADFSGEVSQPVNTDMVEDNEADKARIKKQILEMQKKQVAKCNQNQDILDLLADEKKKERERIKQLEKVTDASERQKLEALFESERNKTKQKMKHMVKRHTEQISALEKDA
jgi:septal ring factor EnvC (AmiA/AmiB activator)